MSKLITLVVFVSVTTLVAGQGQKEGKVTVGDDLTDRLSDTIKITGEAAQKLYDDLRVKPETKKLGSLILSTKKGDQITCSTSLEVKQTFGCSLIVDLRNGKIQDAK